MGVHRNVPPLLLDTPAGVTQSHNAPGPVREYVLLGRQDRLHSTNVPYRLRAPLTPVRESIPSDERSPPPAPRERTKPLPGPPPVVIIDTGAPYRRLADHSEAVVQRRNDHTALKSDTKEANNRKDDNAAKGQKIIAYQRQELREEQRQEQRQEQREKQRQEPRHEVSLFERTRNENLRPVTFEQSRGDNIVSLAPQNVRVRMTGGRLATGVGAGDVREVGVIHKERSKGKSGVISERNGKTGGTRKIWPVKSEYNYQFVDNTKQNKSPLLRAAEAHKIRYTSSSEVLPLCSEVFHDSTEYKERYALNSSFTNELRRTATTARLSLDAQQSKRLRHARNPLPFHFPHGTTSVPQLSEYKSSYVAPSFDQRRRLYRSTTALDELREEEQQQELEQGREYNNVQSRQDREEEREEAWRNERPRSTGARIEQYTAEEDDDRSARDSDRRADYVRGEYAREESIYREGQGKVRHHHRQRSKSRGEQGGEREEEDWEGMKGGDRGVGRGEGMDRGRERENDWQRGDEGNGDGRGRSREGRGKSREMGWEGSERVEGDWFQAVLALRRQAAVNKKRGQQTNFALHHLAQLKSRQTKVWEAVTNNSALSALDLEHHIPSKRRPTTTTRHHLDRTTPVDGGSILIQSTPPTPAQPPADPPLSDRGSSYCREESLYSYTSPPPPRHHPPPPSDRESSQGEGSVYSFRSSDTLRSDRQGYSERYDNDDNDDAASCYSLSSISSCTSELLERAKSRRNIWD